MSLIPLGDRVLIKQDEAEEKTASGLILASESKEKPQRGVVIAVVKPGDHVVFAKYGTNEIEVEGEKLLLMRAEDIYAKYAD